MTQTRKEFLKSIGNITVGACCGGVLLSLGSCASSSSVNGTLNNKTLLVKKSDFQGASTLVVKHLSLKAPIFLSKITEDSYSAVLMLCTHKQCELNPSGAILHCPCHGSEFETNGKLLEGPAETDLEKYKVTVEGEKITIFL